MHRIEPEVRFTRTFDGAEIVSREDFERAMILTRELKIPKFAIEGNKVHIDVSPAQVSEDVRKRLVEKGYVEQKR